MHLAFAEKLAFLSTFNSNFQIYVPWKYLRILTRDETNAIIVDEVDNDLFLGPLSRPEAIGDLLSRLGTVRLL